MKEKKLGIIGGSGLYEIEGLSDIQEHKIETPFGEPSDLIIRGILEGTELFFLPRHGKGHRILPSELNFRANIYAFKKLGVQWIMSISAVGSLKKDIEPGHMVVPDQFFDRSVHRPSTFFGDGIVGHVGFGDPVCEVLRKKIVRAAKEAGAKVHDGGVYVNMNGPQFSTRAESHFYQSIGASIIGMTNLQEAKLAREAEISYSTLALSTDYDCWHGEEESVSADAVVAVIQKNVVMARKVIANLAKDAPEGDSPFKGILKHAIVTDPARIPEETKKKLLLIIGPYIS